MTYIDPANKLLAHLDRVAALQHGGTLPPVNIEIDLSNRCSLGCEWCHFGYLHTRGPLAHTQQHDTGDLIDPELVFDVLRQITDEAFQVRSVVWSGGGEPTLHPNFDHIISAAMLPMGMYTNGCHIAPQRAALIKQRFRWVYISLDAHTAKDYGRQKGVPLSRFEDAVQGITNLVLAPGSATVGVGFLLNPTNWYLAREMFDFAIGYGVDYVQFRPAIEYDLASPSAPAPDVAWVDDAINSLQALSLKRTVELDLSRFYMYRHWDGHPYKRCWWSGLQTIITPDGRVWACANKRGFDNACLGDLNTESFKAIWERAPLQMVNDQCRIMCRGHLPNMQLETLLAGGAIPHKEFI